MAKLKYEFLNHYHQEHGVPLRSRLFANINVLNKLGSRYAPISNWLAGGGLGKSLASTLLGIAPPAPAAGLRVARSLPQWFAQRWAQWT